jgi:hypothetical protein
LRRVARRRLLGPLRLRLAQYDDAENGGGTSGTRESSRRVQGAARARDADDGVSPVALRDASSWYTYHGDGTMSLTVLRRVPSYEGGWEQVECRGADEAECERVYDAECERRAEVSQEQGRRRARWGV